MGQKVNPTGFRLSVNRDWRSRWYASSQEFPSFLHSDLKIRNYVKKKLQFAAVSKIVIERRIAYRRAMKKAVKTAMDFGAEGIRLRCSGRLNGAEISRSEWYREGKIPLHTLRTAVDYGLAESNTVYGKIGVKCWICRKEEPAPQAATPPPPPPEPIEV
ncbi:MAG: 30S ribosomal protein S3 [Verrucomicrobia bacterium]|nr:MAG: 30S ribosomal protein S3 [Verrucomicrobiota bacterium]